MSEPLLSQSLALFEDHTRDAGDTLMAAYRHDTHTKASLPRNGVHAEIAGCFLSTHSPVNTQRLPTLNPPNTHIHTNGTGPQVLEFVCFKERLERAHSYAAARAERAHEGRVEA